MTHGSLFSGIGGFELAAQWMGWDNIFHCEWNQFGQKVLKYHFPKSISYEDITKTDFSIHRGTIDILTGGFPCQPYSTAGKRLGKEDERHLWPEMLRAIREIKPRWVVGENVRGLVSWSGGLVFEEVCTDLEAEGYSVQPYILPAAGVNAPHRRDRVWFVARNTKSIGNSKITKVSRRQNIESFGDNSIERANDKIWSITNTNNTRSNEPLRYNREWSEKDKGWERQPQFKSWQNGFNGSITNSKNSGCRGRESEQCAIRKWELFQGEQTGSTLGCEVEGCSREWTITNTNNNRTGYGLGQIQSENGKVSEWDNDAESCNTDKFNATNSENKGLERMRGEERRFAKLYNRRNENKYWQNFPTVAPVCNGDDGLSDRLDSITFPKWRNESIKAGGNAIVPQVAHQIFKAIQEYEQYYGSRL